MYCLWPLPRILLVCTTLVYVCTHVLLLYTVLVPTLLLFGSFSVLEERRVPGRLPLIGGRNKQTNFSAPFIYSRTSLHLLLQLALHEGHVYCLWPLPHIPLVCTTLVCVLFVATPMSTSSVYSYYCSMCTVCGHSHVY